MTKTENALVVLDKHDFALAKYTAEDLREVILGNLEGEELGPQNLTRIRIPSGGGKAFAVPSVDGDDQVTKTVSGVILHARTQRAYWMTSFDEGGGGNPPDCSSQEGRIGFGSPGGICKDCPLNKFGSAGEEKGGKACREMKLVFLLRPELLLPDVVVLPPTSLGAFKTYATMLTGRAIPFTSIITEIGLTEKQSDGGIKYSQATFRGVERLDPDSQAHVKKYAASMKTALEAVKVQAEPE